MDQLARESFRLTDFHVGTICAPTRSGLMTGPLEPGEFRMQTWLELGK
ncbi:MAG: hypothetical protein GY790_03625 [Bacteroidetes bacterium]|nr:hypothetical protein [Bacteroidota bacterium]